MATLSDTIKGTSGLLAYWPLLDNTDQSGNGRHLTAVGTPQFGQAPMTQDLLPSVVTPATGSTLRIAQSTLPKIRAIEGMFRMAGTKTGPSSTLVGLNMHPSNNQYRYLVFYHTTIAFCVYQDIAPLLGGTRYTSLTNGYDALSAGNHHYVIQLNAAGTQTEVYIDGVKDSAMTAPMDVFLQIAGSYVTIGAYTENGSLNGNCQSSNVAIYDRPLTQSEITARQQYKLGDPVFMPPVRTTTIPANQEPRALFQPQDAAWRGCPPLFPGPVTNQPVSQPAKLCAGRDYFWIRDGVQNAHQGYIESTVTIDGEGVSRRVLCYTQDGELVAETMSRASDGKYRFDLLWLNRRYMLVAQDDPAFGPADYNAVAADFQLPTPYAPGEGVGLA